MSERQQNQGKLQGVNRDEDREMQGYLTPVQHARYQEARRRFQERVAEVLRHRREQRRQVLGPRGGGRKRPRPQAASRAVGGGPPTAPGPMPPRPRPSPRKPLAT